MVATATLLVWASAVAIVDLRTRRIGNVVLLLAFVPSLLSLVLRGQGLAGQDWSHSGLGLLASGAVFLPGFLVKASGGGDVKFAAVCGGITGLQGSVVMMLVAMGALGFASLVTLLVRRVEDGGKRRLPAGPAIAAGFAVALLVGLD